MAELASLGHRGEFSTHTFLLASVARLAVSSRQPSPVVLERLTALAFLRHHAGFSTHPFLLASAVRLAASSARQHSRAFAE